MEEIFDYIEYSENSKTNLIVKKDRFLWNKRKIYSIGQSIGSFRYRENGDPKCINIVFNGKVYYVHNLIWQIFTGKTPNCIIDHIDGNPFNNNIENLREVTPDKNSRNAKILAITYREEQLKLLGEYTMRHGK